MFVGERLVEIGVRSVTRFDSPHETIETAHAVELVLAARSWPYPGFGASTPIDSSYVASGTGNGWPSLPPCANEKRAGSSNRVGLPWTTSAMSASACSVRGPRFSTRSSDAKSRSSRSCATARTAPSRFKSTSLDWTSWRRGITSFLASASVSCGILVGNRQHGVLGGLGALIHQVC